MDSTKVIEYARQLVEAHGSAAEAEAAKKASDMGKAGKADEAEQWRRVRIAIAEMKPPHES